MTNKHLREVIEVKRDFMRHGEPDWSKERSDAWVDALEWTLDMMNRVEKLNLD